MIDASEICAILLAAGGSRRFGAEDKLLVSLEGQPLALHAAQRMVELAPGRRIAVCHNADGALAQQLAERGFEIVANPQSDRGLSHSLTCGIAEAARGRELAAMICLADMPFISAGHLRRLLDRFDPVTAPVVGSNNGIVAMPPALFGRALFGRLSDSAGDSGGKALLAGAATVTARACELADIDRPEDLRG